MTFSTSDRPFIQIGEVIYLKPSVQRQPDRIALTQAAAADDGRTARRYLFLYHNSLLFDFSQHGFRLVARLYPIQRVVEKFAQSVPQTLPTLRRSSIPPEKDQGRARIPAEADRLAGPFS